MMRAEGDYQHAEGTGSTNRRRRNSIASRPILSKRLGTIALRSSGGFSGTFSKSLCPVWSTTRLSTAALCARRDQLFSRCVNDNCGIPSIIV